MIFRVVRRFARLQLRRPTIRPDIKPEDMIDKETLLKEIKKTNEWLANTQDSLFSKLSKNMDKSVAQQLKNVEFQQIAYNGERQHRIYYKPYENTHRLTTTHIHNDFRPFKPTEHYSLNSPVMNIDEYNLTERQLMVFNLPATATSTNLQSLMPQIKIKNATIQYCMAGLPAYAKLLIENAPTARKYRQIEKYDCQSKTCIIRAHNDNSIQLKNRMLAIQDIPSGMSPDMMFSRLSQFGRVMNFHMPMDISRRVSKQQVKQIFTDSNNLIRIVEHKSNGTTDIEYFPTEQPNFSALQDIQMEKYIEDYVTKRVQYEKRLYEARIRSCQDVECYENPDVDPIKITNKGFCIVVFSCMEQAQNCYFHLMEQFKVENGYKPQFTYDAQHRKRILRYISNRVEQKQLELYKKSKFRSQMIDEENESEDEQMPMETLLSEMYIRAQYGEEQAELLQEDKDIIKETKEQREKREQLEAQKERRIRGKLPDGLKKKGIGASKSFSQLAQLQLFGAVLPKKQKKPRQQLELELDKRVAYHQPIDQVLYGLENIEAEEQAHDEIEEQVENQAELQRLSKQGFAKKVTKKMRKQMKEQKKKKAAEEAELGDGQDAGKASFSTGKAISQYREPTQKEKYQRIIAYNSMIKELVEQFFGKFSQKKLNTNEKTFQYPTLNRNRVFKTDKTDFLTEEQLPLALEMHSSQEEAKTAYEQYYKFQHLYKSMPYGWRQDFLENMKTKQSEIQQHLSDVGIVEQVFKMPENEQPTAFVNELNLYESKQGQHFQQLQKDGQKYVVKTVRMEPKLDITHVQKFKKVAAADMSQLSEQEIKMSQNIAQEMLKTGQVPQSLKDLLGSDQEVQSMIEEMIGKTGLPHKFFETLYKSKPSDLHKYKGDFARQLEVEKARVNKRQPTDEDFVKGVQMADVKKKNGRYRTSRYKQI